VINDDASHLRRPIKRLGQNFLVNEKIASEIVDSGRVSRADTVIEPGPGKGALTQYLVEKAGQVIAVEKDPILARQLEDNLGQRHGNLTIIVGDMLKVQLPIFNKLICTPPYYLSSKLILLLVRTRFELASLVLQKEFGERLSAKPGSAEYGRLSVLSNRFFNIQITRTIPRSAFYPQPRIDSILIVLSKKQDTRQDLDEQLYMELVRGIFTQRRRLVRGALTHFLALRTGRAHARQIMGTFQIPDKRVFELSPEEIEELSVQLALYLQK
jgi:16S rRNA (adenine1518-N6/adenine1519-N6)-dimethyltransferase